MLPITVPLAFIALLELPFLPAIMINLPKSALLIMLITAMLGGASSINIYTNYIYFRDNW
jgi:hypothetical protein